MKRLSCFFGFHNDELLEAKAFIDTSYDRRIPSVHASYRCVTCNKVTTNGLYDYYGKFASLAGAEEYVEKLKKSFEK